MYGNEQKKGLGEQVWDLSSGGLDLGYDFSPLDNVLDVDRGGGLEIGEGQFGDPLFGLAFVLGRDRSLASLQGCAFLQKGIQCLFKICG